MITSPAYPGIGFEWLGPDIDKATAELRAWQISHFMREEIHGPVYEQTFGLRFIDTDPPSGTPGDIPWRVENMGKYNRVLPDGTHTEYVVAYHLDDQGHVSSDRLAVAGLLVARKPEGVCTEETHKPTTIVEIDVARRLRGQRLGPYMLSLLTHTHREDPSIELEVYEGNVPAIGLYERLGFSADDTPQVRPGDVYEGQWVTMRTTGEEYYERLQGLL